MTSGELTLDPNYIRAPRSADGGAISFTHGAAGAPCDAWDRTYPAVPSSGYPLVFGIGIRAPVNQPMPANCSVTVGASPTRYRECLRLTPLGAVYVWGRPVFAPRPRSKRKRAQKKRLAKGHGYDMELWAALRAWLVGVLRESTDFARAEVHTMRYITGAGYKGGKAGSIVFGSELRFDADGKTRVKGKEVDAQGAYEALRSWVFSSRVSP